MPGSEAKKPGRIKKAENDTINNKGITTSVTTAEAIFGGIDLKA
jgi:hypothetical protein